MQGIFINNSSLNHTRDIEEWRYKLEDADGNGVFDSLTREKKEGCFIFTESVKDFSLALRRDYPPSFFPDFWFKDFFEAPECACTEMMPEIERLKRDGCL